MKAADKTIEDAHAESLTVQQACEAATVSRAVACAELGRESERLAEARRALAVSQKATAELEDEAVLLRSELAALLQARLYW